MSNNCLISFMLVFYTAIVLSHRPGEQLMGSIERLEKLHKAIEDETKILKIRASIVVGDSEGYAGGSLYTHTGAAANYLCLPSDPQWSKKAMAEMKKSVSVAFVYGSEYQLDVENAGIFVNDISPISDDVPCAVCKTERTNILMIPGRTTCYDGWKREYTGYIVAGRPNHAAASEYVCLDEIPEAAEGSLQNENGMLFYLTVAKCGSLPCPPYVDGRLLSCVVCTM